MVTMEDIPDECPEGCPFKGQRYMCGHCPVTLKEYWRSWVEWLSDGCPMPEDDGEDENGK